MPDGFREGRPLHREVIPLLFVAMNLSDAGRDMNSEQELRDLQTENVQLRQTIDRLMEELRHAQGDDYTDVEDTPTR